MFGKITVVRDGLFCRRCHKGHGENDEILNLNRVHKLTKGMIEAITYVSQLVPSFERASEVLKKFLHVDISSTQMQIISEEIGKEVFESQIIAANKAYEKPEETVPSILEKDKKEGILYIMVDGSAVNIRIKDDNNSCWKEMKLGLIFSDRDLIKEEKVDEALKYISVKLIKNLPTGVGNVYNYIENNKDRIKYKTYKEKGYYIGGGPIESGNKVVIQQRMKQSGMRWSVSGGQYIAALRAKYESDLWNKVVQIVNA